MLRRRPLPRLLVLTLPLAALVSAAAANAGSKQQLYAVGKPVCKQPKQLLTAHQATCTALRRVFVKAGTKGALPFTPAAGATGAATMGPNLGLTPSDIVSAYHLSTSPTAGSGQTIALVDAFNDPNIESDLGTFDTNYGLPACTKANGCLTVVSQTGSTSALPADDTTGWSVEESLDVEAAHGACPACHILLVEADSESNSDLGTAENEAAALHATEISNSFGEPEVSDPTFQNAFNHQGIVITASSGDDGYYSFDWLGIFGPPDVNAPDIPSSYNTVVAVGGTSLYLGQNATRTSETVWNDDGPQAFYEANLGIPLGAGGGGCSTMVAGRGWQTHVSGYSSAACGGKRLVADISMVADPLTGFDIYDSYDCGSAQCPASPSWLTIGGTSLSSPLVAAAYALGGGAHGVGYPSILLYGHPSSVYDVTVGGNGICDGEGAAQCPNYSTNGDFDLGAGMLDCAYTPLGTIAVGTGACDAAAGFDGPTGVGTPNSMTLFAKIVPTVQIAGPATATHGVSADWSASATDPFPGGTFSGTSFSWSWGDGSSTLNVASGTQSHTYLAPGTFTITVTAKDQYLMAGTKTLQVTVS